MSSPGPPAHRTGSKKPVKKPGKPKKPHKDPSNAKDFRYLETAKMVKHMMPITINGYAVAKIFENEIISREASAKEALVESENRQASPSSESQPKPSRGKKVRLSKKIKEDVVCKHIKKIIDRDSSQAIYLSFMMQPEDPDFPYDIDTLNFNLAVPADYGRNQKALPSIIVLNTDIPRGFSINVEKGFAHIAGLAKDSRQSDERITLVGKGLLGQVQTLNKYLEFFLSQEKRDTMKFVTFKSDKKRSVAVSERSSPAPNKPIREAHSSQTVTPPQSRASSAPVETTRFTSESQSRRTREIEEMCQKLQGSVKLFNRTTAESRYKVQIPISSQKDLPILWCLSNSIDLFVVVPMSYPNAKPRISTAANFSNNLMVAKKKSLEARKESLIDVVAEYKRAEANVATNTGQVACNSLLQLLNYIANNLGALTMDAPAYAAWVQAMATLKATA